MKGSIEEDVEAQILSPANELRLQKEEKEAFKHGLLFEKFPEILVNGHSTFTTTRIDKMSHGCVFELYFYAHKVQLQKSWESHSVHSRISKNIWIQEEIWNKIQNVFC